MISHHATVAPFLHLDHKKEKKESLAVSIVQPEEAADQSEEEAPAAPEEKPALLA